MERSPGAMDRVGEDVPAAADAGEQVAVEVVFGHGAVREGEDPVRGDEGGVEPERLHLDGRARPARAGVERITRGVHVGPQELEARRAGELLDDRAVGVDQ